jgi:hypothetical protein
MPKFRVTLIERVYESLEQFVDAPDAEKAEQIAIEESWMGKWESSGHDRSLVSVDIEQISLEEENDA